VCVISINSGPVSKVHAAWQRPQKPGSKARARLRGHVGHQMIIEGQAGRNLMRDSGRMTRQQVHLPHSNERRTTFVFQSSADVSAFAVKA
ncbi:hypothetical protein BaRGS_00005118, partial [Batillaria attramentaria]